jgi:DNA polymerase lambda/DNA polymerase IV
MKSPSLEEKVAFFDQLDALDNLSDGDDEVDQKEQDHRDKCRAFFKSREKSGRAKESTSTHPTHPRRTTSMPTPAADHTPGPRVIEATPAARKPGTKRPTGVDRLLDRTASFVEETPVPDTARPLPATLRRSTTLPLAASSAAEQSPSAATARKRKRQSSTKSVPESAQVFRGLSFYYIPNNDIAPARKLRIAKAQEYGARWVRNLGDASHVIVDKHLEYKDIESIVGAEPAPSLVIVYEEYPIDCISFRALLNPDQHRYRVTGCAAKTEQVAAEDVPIVPSQTSDRSLQVKPVRTSTRRDSDDTPPGSKQSSLRSDARVVEQSSGYQTSGVRDSHSAPGAQIQRASPPQHGSHPPQKPEQPPRRRSSTKDELSEYIELLQQYRDLPLDQEEDDVQSVKDAQEAVSDSEIDEGSEDERARKRTAKTRRAGHKEIAFEDRFACNRGGTKDRAADAQNPNARTIEVLQSMCDYYSRINDNWRTIAYRKAINTLRRQTVKITTEEEAYRLPNIGQRLAAKIEEIASTNKLRRLEYANDEPLDQVLEVFLKIYDVGTSRANKWISQGFRTLDDLLKKADLTPNQRIGIEHYDHLNTRIPREEITALFAYVQREAAQVDPAVELLVGGSYRRGSDSSGDIDIIITKKGTTSAADLVPFLEELVANLTRKGFLVATLAALHAYRPGKDGPGSKWHGCCVLPRESADDRGDAPNPIWRRIDFLLVPESEYGAALIYFTGNDIFNRSMRLLASKKGMRLNQKGLFKEVMRGKNKVKVTEGELLEGKDEKRIFELLGVKWREPWERWC